MRCCAASVSICAACRRRRKKSMRSPSDTSTDAYEKAVDRFLKDAAYGERWARMWLDLARYADSAGYGSDPLRPHIWRYRDWVIDAFNRNLPYDRFTIEQLAGDLLPNADARTAHRDGVSSQHHDQHRRRHRRRGVPRRRRQGSRRYDHAGVDGADDGLRQVSQPQIRSDYSEGILSLLCLLQPDRRQRSAGRAPTVPAPTPDMQEQRRRSRRPHRCGEKATSPQPSRVAVRCCGGRRSPSNR